MIYRMSFWQNTLGSHRLTRRGHKGHFEGVGDLFFPVPGAAYRDVFTLWKQGLTLTIGALFCMDVKF